MFGSKKSKDDDSGRKLTEEEQARLARMAAQEFGRAAERIGRREARRARRRVRNDRGGCGFTYCSGCMIGGILLPLLALAAIKFLHAHFQGG